MCRYLIDIEAAGKLGKEYHRNPVAVTQDAIIDALSRVEDPELHRDIVSPRHGARPEIDGDTVSMTLMLTTPACPLRDTIKATVAASAARAPGVDAVDRRLDAEVRCAAARAADRKPVEGVQEHHRRRLATRAASASRPSPRTSPSRWPSTARKVGLLDADITGPNIPTMMGFEPGFQAESRAACSRRERYGVRVCSIGFALPQGTPVVWRGPMIGTAVRDFLHNIDWGELDYLIVDLPPGTSRRVDEHGAGGADRRRRHRQHAAGRRARGRHQGGVDVRPAAGARLRHHREHELLRLRRTAATATRFSATAAPRRRPKSSAWSSSGEMPLDPATREGGDSGEPVVLAAAGRARRPRLHHNRRARRR